MSISHASSSPGGPEYPFRRRGRPLLTWPKALVVHFNEATATELRLALDVAGLSTRTASAIETARAELASWQPDLLLLHLPSPRRPALDFLRTIDPQWLSGRLVIGLTSGGAQIDRSVEAALGVQHWIRERASTEDLMLALRNKLEQLSNRVAGKVLGYFPSVWASVVAGPLVVNVLGRYVDFHGRRKRLTPMELRLLLYFIENRARTCPESEIREKVWGFSGGATKRVYTVLKRVREVFSALGQVVELVPGAGFRLSARFRDVVFM